MKTWLCHPISNFFSPLQGIGRLYAYLRKNGYDVSYIDLNQKCFFKLLNEEYLSDCFNKLNNNLFSIGRASYLKEHIGAIILKSSRNYIATLLKNDNFDFINNSVHAKGYEADCSSLVYELIENREHLIEHISTASQKLATHFLSLKNDDFLKHYKTLLCGKAIYDAVYSPTLLDFGFGLYSTRFSLEANDIYQIVLDEKSNFLIPFYKKEILPLLEKEQPQIIGISITHSSEIIPAFTLSQIIKSSFPHIHVCLGGATISEVAYKLYKNKILWQFFDSIISGPGEVSFSILIEHIKHSKQLNKVPNLIYKSSGQLKKSIINHEFDINTACTPEYPTLLPGSPVSLETSSGCYWGKCIFCYYPKTGMNNQIKCNPSYKERNIDLVSQDLQTLKTLYNPSFIGFTDSSIHPNRLDTILTLNQSKNLNLKFSGFIRFEKEFLSTSFCQSLSKRGFLGGQLGLESGSQRVNNIINKGVDVRDAQKILKNFFNNEILIHLYTMVGIPGETKDDSLLTYNFLHTMRKYLLLDWQIYSFSLLENAPFIGKAFNKNITIFPPLNNYLSQYLGYQVKSGISQEESLTISINYSEKLKKYLHPLADIMDIESYKMFLFSRKAKSFCLGKKKYYVLKRN